MESVTLGIIVGSTRPNRIGRKIADQIADNITNREFSKELKLKCEIIDLLEWNLPMYNEPGMPRHGQYTNSRTIEWSKKIKEMSAIMFVTPQYNWGYPASLKNAIDYLYKEWNDKPAIVISYGSRGGGKAADQLRQVLQGVRMNPIERMPGIALKEQDLTKIDGLVNKYKDEIDRAVDDMLQTYTPNTSI